jgi:RecA/RadA recombinase
MAEKGGLKLTMTGLLKAKGSRVVGSGATLPTRDRRITSGSLMLDIVMGGGVPIGRPISFWGDKSGGKSTSAARIGTIFQGICRNCFRPARNIVAVPPTEAELAEDPHARWSATGECDCFSLGVNETTLAPEPRETKEKATDYAKRCEEWTAKMKANSYEETIVAWLDPENSFDADYFEKLGGDARRLLYALPSTGEEAVDILEALGSTLCVDLLILDSIAHLTPRDEINKSAEEWQQGLQARIVNKGVRKAISKSADNWKSHRRMTQIWINQTRMKIGMMYGDPSVKPGGMGQEFGAHVEIRFRGSKMETLSEQYGSKEDVLAIPIEETFNFVNTKNKTSATRQMKGDYTQAARDTDSYPAGTVLEDELYFKMAMKYLVQQPKQGTYVMGDEEFKSQLALRERLADKQVRTLVRHQLLYRLTDMGKGNLVW